MYQKFIGMDIGKEEFYVNIYGQKEVKKYTNNKKGFAQLQNDLRNELTKGFVVLETTGGYEMALIRFLQAKHYAVHRANTRKVKHFIRSHGRLGKSDSIDARGLSHYGYERHQLLPLYVENVNDMLFKLVNRRNDLVKMMAQEKNRLQSPEQEVLKTSFEVIIASLREEIQAIEEKIQQLIQDTPEYYEQKEILKTIPGIGEVSAIQLLAFMPELGKLNRKQIASLGGLAPHPNESGKWIGHRYTRGGRSSIKPALFLSALSASRSCSKLGVSYKKFIDLGKPKMVALTALMRKILVIANAKIRDYYAEQHGKGDFSEGKHDAESGKVSMRNAA